MDENRDDDNVWKMLSVLRELADEDGTPRGIAAGEAEIRRLMISRCAEQLTTVAKRGRLNATLHRLSGLNPSTEACLQWIKSTGQLSELHLNRIRRTNPFRKNANGNIVLKEQPLSYDKAVFLISMFSVFAGIWIGWIAFTNNVGVLQIIYSLAVGMSLGTLAGIVFDNSFRFAEMRDAIVKVAPWFQDRDEQ